MLRNTLSAIILALALVPTVKAADEAHPILPIGASAPDFSLPGIDGKTHSLKDYSSSKILVIIFTCNHCPTAQLYENRIKKLVSDYQARDVAFVAIEPNNPLAVRLNEMGYTDVGDSLADMKIRADYRHFNFPYLYDGETQSTARAYGPSATPHVFIFDAERKLRYEGRIDNNPREPYVTQQDARAALDSLLAGKAVAVAKTPSFGCSTKWSYKAEGRKLEMAEIAKEPVNLKPASADDLKALRKNPTGKLLLVDFWATWCGPCVQALPEYQTMYRMYRHRKFDVVTVSANYPDAKTAVQAELDGEHASTNNLLFGTMDIYSLMAAFDPEWNGALPYTVLIKPDGEVIYRHQGDVDPLEVRRLIQANLPDDNYVGTQAHWQEK